MKKILSVLLLLLLGLASLPLSVRANSDFRFDNDNQEVKFTRGMEHRRVNGKLIYKEQKTNQYYNYLSTGTSRNSDYHIVTVDQYVNNGYGMQPMNVFIDEYEKANPHMEVLAGLNGDFYQINGTGQANNTHVKNYEVITPGTNNSVAFITDNTGRHYIQKTTLEGNEVLVYNKNNEIKYREKVTGFNQQATNEDGLTVLFNNFSGNIPTNLNPIFIEGEDIKMLTYDPIKPPFTTPLFGKGHKVNTVEVDKVPENHFVIISSKVNEIIEDGDKVVFQAKLKGYENVMSAASTYFDSRTLISNGKVKPSNDGNRGPRTSIGIKENGEVFFIVVDGRDRITPKDGFTIEEMARLMEQYGAVEAINMDGGGSATLMLRNDVEEGTVLERFDVLNELSDGRIRSISNGFLLVKGDILAKPLNISGVTNRGKFEVPTNLFIDDQLNLNFDPVDGAEIYQIFINDLMIETTKTIVPLKGLNIGDNKIEVRVRGTLDNMTSDYKASTNYRIYSQGIKSLLNLLNKSK